MPSSKLTASDFRDGATCPGEFGVIDHGNKTGDLNSMAKRAPSVSVPAAASNCDLADTIMYIMILLLEK